MPSVSFEEFLIWKKKQLSKGGDQQSFAVLLDCIGGLSASDLNLMSINLEGKLHLKKKLEFLESVWHDHLLNSCPIQYLCGITFWRDLKLKVTKKSTNSETRDRAYSRYCLQYISKEVREIIFC